MSKASSFLDYELNQTDLDVIYDWSMINQLPLSQPKSQCLNTGHKNGRHIDMLGGTPIFAVEECINLGIIRISDFSHETHINSVVRKAFCLRGMLFGAFPTRSVLFKTKLYIAYVRPTIEYAVLCGIPQVPG